MSMLVPHESDGTHKRSWTAENADTLTSGSRFADDVSSTNAQKRAKKRKESKSTVNYGCHFYYLFVIRILSII